MHFMSMLQSVSIVYCFDILAISIFIDFFASYLCITVLNPYFCLFSAIVLIPTHYPKYNYALVVPSNRIIGGLLAAHLIILDDAQPFGDMRIDDYDNELLYLAHDLAARLLPAFENTATGIPYPRVSFKFFTVM